MEITKQWLEEMEACEDGLIWFEENFPEYGPTVEKLKEKLIEKKKYNWLEWLFENAKLSGEFVWYHPNGQVEVKRTYHEGKLEGECVRYHPNGQVEVKRTYHEGKQIK